MLQSAVKSASSRLTIPALGALFGDRLIRLSTLRKGVLAVADQAIVSGTNLATTVVIGRVAGAAELGIYSLAFTLLVLITSVQYATATAPYVYFAAGYRGSARRRYAGSTLLQVALLAVLASAVLLLVATMVGRRDNAVIHPGIVLMLAGTVPFVLLREFLRRFAFAHLRMGAAVLLDAAVAAVHLALLLGLARAAVLGAVTAHAAIGISSAVVAVGALALARGAFRLRAAAHLPVWQKNWRFGKWELAGHLAIVGHAYLIHWLLAYQVGPAATGAFAACLTVVALSRPLRHGLSNLLETKTARAYAAGGMAQLRRFVSKTTILMATTIGAFSLAVALWGPLGVDLMFGNQFADCGWLMVVLALSVFAQALSYGPLFGLRAVARTNWNCLASVTGLGLAAGSALFLLPWLGLLGGGVAVLAGDVGALSVRAFAFWRCGGGRSV